MKKRADSLFAKMTPDQREDLFLLCLEQGASLQEGLKLLSDWQLSSSPAALSRLLTEHGMVWRLDRAKMAASARKDSLPKDWEESKRQGLAQKEFELTFRDLSAKEWYLLKSIELDERAMKLKETVEPKKLNIAERRVILLEKKVNDATGVLGDQSLSETERTTRMKQIFGIS